MVALVAHCAPLRIETGCLRGCAHLQGESFSALCFKAEGVVERCS